MKPLFIACSITLAGLPAPAQDYKPALQSFLHENIADRAATPDIVAAIRAQISAAISDPSTGVAIGTMTVGVNAEMLL